MKLDEIFEYDEQYVKDVISETVDKRKVGFDYVGLSLYYNNEENSEKIADFLVKYGLVEQYYSFLKLNKDIDISREFERVKKYQKCFGAIANFLQDSERRYCEYKIIETGKAMDILKYMMIVKDCDKIALSQAIIKTNNANAIAYTLKYVDDFTFKLLQGLDMFYEGKQQKIIDVMLQIVQNSTSDFAKKIAYETVNKINACKSQPLSIAIGHSNNTNEKERDMAV